MSILSTPVPIPVARIPASSRQVGGTHYTRMKIQPFEFSMANNLDPMRHTIIKYLCRKKDNVLQDLEKAKHTIELLIEWEQKNGQ